MAVPEYYAISVIIQPFADFFVCNVDNCAVAAGEVSGEISCGCDDGQAMSGQR